MYIYKTQNKNKIYYQVFNMYLALFDLSCTFAKFGKLITHHTN